MVVQNRVIVFLTIAAIILVVCIQSVVIVHNDHMDKLYLVMEKEVEEAAFRCFAENQCTHHVTVQELYNKSYLEKIVNPRNKEYLNAESIITINNYTPKLKIAE